MSIIDEITRIQNAKAKLKLNLENKGVSVGDEKLDVMVDFVSDIKDGIDTTDGTATSNDILLGKTAYVNDEKIEGTIETYNSKMTDGAEIINNTLDITANGEYDVKEYAKANVNVKSNEDGLIERTLTSYSNDRVTSIGEYAFYQQSTLESVDFPNVTSLGLRAFKNCRSLKKVIIEQKESVCTLNADAFDGCYHILGTVNETYNPDGLADGYIYVPDELVEDYKIATNWSTYASQIKPLSELEE